MSVLERFIKHLNTGISGIERFITTIIMFLQFGVFYLIANRFIAMENTHDISTFIDNALPFMPNFIYPYSFIYLFAFLPALIITDRKFYFKCYAGFTVLTIISALIFVLYPVKVVRLYEIPPGFTGLIYTGLTWLDNPVCGFPSLHVGWTLLATLVVFRFNRKIGWFCIFVCMITMLSTMLTKQHVLGDVIGGIVMAFLIDLIIISDWSPMFRSAAERIRPAAGKYMDRTLFATRFAGNRRSIEEIACESKGLGCVRIPEEDSQ